MYDKKAFSASKDYGMALGDFCFFIITETYFTVQYAQCTLGPS